MERHGELTEPLDSSGEGFMEGERDQATINPEHIGENAEHAHDAPFPGEEGQKPPEPEQPQAAQEMPAWPEPDEHGLTTLGGVRFDRGAIQLLNTEYTPQEIEQGLSDSNPRDWVRRLNQEHLERHNIGRLQLAGTTDTPVISGHRFAGFERRGRGMR